AEAKKALAMDCEIVPSRDYHRSDENGDENWIRRFERDGGKVIITGDTRIRTRPHERAALAETGVITFVFGPPWNAKKFHDKTSLLINSRPDIVQRSKTARAGSCWEIPYDFSDTVTIADITGKPGEITRRRIRRRDP